MKYLADTSVWIEFSHGRFDLARLIAAGEVATCLPVIQEVLQGADTETDYRDAHDLLFSLPLVDSPVPEAAFMEAIGLYRTARRNALTPRSGVDCLIAVCAMRNNLEVLHDDRDFVGLARVSVLRQRQI